jgi:16S rRNA (adenine1518-N6/adenine1519-N6)-dimethyltransferase
MNRVTPKKALGQHFLKDKNIVQKIAQLIVPFPDETILEIGPGAGALTRELLSIGNRIEAVDLDIESIQYLKENFLDPRLHLFHQNILKFSPEQDKYFFVGNLPYNVSSPILFYLLENRAKCRKAVFMLQKEVAERIVASPGNKTYGVFSVLLGAYYERRLAFTVPSGAFFPPPKVQSAVIILERKEEINSFNFTSLKKLVKLAFNQRRKTLKNALKSLPLALPSHIEGKRAEQLAIETFIELSRFEDKDTILPDV